MSIQLLPSLNKARNCDVNVEALKQCACRSRRDKTSKPANPPPRFTGQKTNWNVTLCQLLTFELQIL